MAEIEQRYDLVIVGGGIGGSALATVMARDGKQVLVLERTTEYPDMVRGEWIAPWGVIETQRLGLYDMLASYGHHITRHVRYGDDAPEDPEAAGRELSGILPGVNGPLALGHPRTCQSLADAAAESGATVLRGVSGATVTPGPMPCVAFEHDGVGHQVYGRLIVGADGRNSTVRGQAGIELHRDPAHHLFTGLLVEDAHGWDERTQATGTEGPLNYLIFPQGEGRVRLYLGFPYEDRSRFSGPEGPQRFLEAFAFETLPDHTVFTNARAAGPCNAYPNEDTWTETPYTDGVILIGDAAGWNDPIVGQGLSITMRDVRIVSDLLKESDDWSPAAFAPYAEERAERMRRLRFAATIVAKIDCEFGPEGEAQRQRARARMGEDPTLGMALGGVMVGPELMPESAFDPSVMERIFGQ